MFGSRKAKANDALAEAGWQHDDLDFLVRELSREQPVIRLALTGHRQLFATDASEYSAKLRMIRADRQMYGDATLLSEGAPEEQASVRLVRQEHEIVGRALFGRVCASGSFGVRQAGDGYSQLELGWLNVTVMDRTADHPQELLLQFSFTLETESQIDALADALRGVLGAARGAAYVNLVCERLENAEDWKAAFLSKGYSTTLSVSAVFVNIEAGGPFE